MCVCACVRVCACVCLRASVFIFCAFEARDYVETVEAMEKRGYCVQRMNPKYNKRRPIESPPPSPPHHTPPRGCFTIIAQTSLVSLQRAGTNSSRCQVVALSLHPRHPLRQMRAISTYKRLRKSVKNLPIPDSVAEFFY